jgi:hypothetical protein
MYKITSTGKCKYQCDSCDSIGFIDCKDVTWEWMDTSIRNMGLEKMHVASVDRTCPCGQEIRGEFMAWEYPMGMISHQDFKIRGAKLIHKMGVLIKISPEKLF